ncbi:histidine kinase [Massilia sp. Dwa41.01b]|uniref:sensor histidine kinase n=1 Tax=unclassified Massilia TaxID=2609279 RepID=UPI0016005CB6|nr:MULTISPECIES: ATP-binding protein [unclassified Massilia]QNA88797.1 histidine kinase [Massilia sp. Dwa41.01b]QNA99695.1 histidine kinase [Massilia sp. Se16.2.3]
MTAPEPQHLDPELERQVAERTAALTELVAHLMNCWDDDRRLLARKLHDSLGSSMTALTMHLGLLSKGLTDAKAVDRANQMKSLLNGIIETNRKVQLTLWNDKLEFLGIKAALTELVAEFSLEHGITARVSLPDDDDAYTRPQNVALLRCAEEGLRNALHHANARTIDVILDDDGDQLMLTVRDDGAGMANGQPESLRCHGLRLLRERARALGGSVSLETGREGGAALTMILPRHAPA